MRLLFPTIPLPIPALEAPTKAPWPVWAGSTTTPIRFAPMPKKAAVRLWHRARDFDRGTHQPGQHGGSVGPTALAVLHCADLRLPEPPHRPPRPVLCGDRAQGRRLRPHGRHGAAAAARAGHPQLGAPLRRELARRALRARAGDQRLRRAAGEPVAWLPRLRGFAVRKRYFSPTGTRYQIDNPRRYLAATAENRCSEDLPYSHALIRRAYDRAARVRTRTAPREPARIVIGAMFKKPL